MTRKSFMLLIFLSLICAGIGSSLLTGTSAQSASTGNLNMITRLEDSFRNYDFLPNPTLVRADRVDWAVTLLFFNNANVAKVKIFLFSGSTMYCRYDNGPGFQLDGDDGSKSVACPATGYAYHYRVYGRLYNTDWGYYVFSTTHADHDECNPFYNSFGSMEDETENYVAGVFRNRGYKIQPNFRSFSNYEAPRTEGDHRWNNDGYATAVNIT